MHIEDGTLLSHMYTVTALFPSQSSLIMMIYGLESHFSEIQASSDEKHAILLMIERAQVDTKCFVIRVEKVGDAVDWLEQLSMDVGAKHYQLSLSPCLLDFASRLIPRIFANAAQPSSFGTN